MLRTRIRVPPRLLRLRRHASHRARGRLPASPPRAHRRLPVVRGTLRALRPGVRGPLRGKGRVAAQSRPHDRRGLPRLRPARGRLRADPLPELSGEALGAVRRARRHGDPRARAAPPRRADDPARAEGDVPARAQATRPARPRGPRRDRPEHSRDPRSRRRHAGPRGLDSDVRLLRGHLHPHVHALVADGAFNKEGEFLQAVLRRAARGRGLSTRRALAPAPRRAAVGGVPARAI